jgi:N-acetylmuramoyl-L-alanine amidase
MAIRCRRPRLLLPLVIAVWLAASAPAAPASATAVAAVPVSAVEVRDVRVSAGPECTRVILDLSASAQHSWTVLKNPDRLVLDVAGGRLARRMPVPTAAAGAVRQVRAGRQPSGALRLVFDLSRPVSATVSANRYFLEPGASAGYRLVIDLTVTAPGTVKMVRQPQVQAQSQAQPQAPHPPQLQAQSQAQPQAPHPPQAQAQPQPQTQTQTQTHHPPQAQPQAQHLPQYQPQPEARTLVIAIDAGHGGEDPGAIGKHGTQEKDVVLAIARALARCVNGEPGMRAMLTRDGDYFVPLRDRIRRARAAQADLFVSIHADSIRDRSVDGSSVYILSQRGATDEASRWLAERQNAADLIGGVSLEDKGDELASVLLDMSQSASLSASQAAAEHVLHQLNRVGEIRKSEVQQARFVVLKSPDIPSMLVETAYISNPQEELRLRGSVHQAKLAAAIHQGLRAYFYDDPPAGTRVAELAEHGSAPAAAPAHPVLATAQANSGG